MPLLPRFPVPFLSLVDRPGPEALLPPREVTQWIVMAFRVTSAVQQERQINPRSHPWAVIKDATLPVLMIKDMTHPIKVLRATSRCFPLEGPWSNEVVLINGRMKR